MAPKHKPTKAKTAIKAPSKTSKALSAAKTVSLPKTSATPAAKAVSKPAAKPQRMEIDLPDMTHWKDNAFKFAQSNPSALVAGALAVMLGVLLLLP
ncbi:MAG: hypothetical protein WAZ18_03050 [Alphaproteobacteria bacterium]